jgi:hypothetical protein
MGRVERTFRQNNLSFSDQNVRRWHGSSVWLADLNGFFVVRRCLFGSHPWRGLISCLLMQLYSRGWSEIRADFSVPSDADGELRRATVSFPSILEFGGAFATDPRVYLHENVLGFVEPVILFQTMKQGYWSSEMYFVFSKRHLPLRLHTLFRHNEKNWAFFDHNSTHVKFVASLSPLRIVDCRLSSGRCSGTQGPPYSEIGELRPGTQFVAIPSPSALGVRAVYIGWARAHLRYCRPPVWRFYRPNLVVLVRDSTNIMSIVGVSDFIDFGCRIPHWPHANLSSGCIDDVSVLLPCSIPLWNLRSDCMLVTLSASDISVSVVEVEGVGHIVRELFKAKMDVSRGSSESIVTAAMSSSRRFCRRFTDDRLAQCPGG